MSLIHGQPESVILISNSFFSISNTFLKIKPINTSFTFKLETANLPNRSSLAAILPLSNQKVTHAPTSFHLIAQPIPLYAPLDVQLLYPFGHPHSHAPPMFSGQQLSTINLSNLYSKHPLYVDPLQQPLFSGTEIDQPQNRSDIEAGKSSTHSKPTKLPMYSKNSITSFPNLLSNYITGSLGSYIGNFSGEKLNEQNYFSWSQSVKMFLEGHHQFDFLTGETYGTSDLQASTICSH
uniref:Kirola-like n=1 Tax=Cucumis melo TaxID=3656 RepID=A0A9I9E9X8_CUCME